MLDCLYEESHVDIGDDGISLKAYNYSYVHEATPCGSVSIRRSTVRSGNICVGGSTFCMWHIDRADRAYRTGRLGNTLHAVGQEVRDASWDGWPRAMDSTKQIWERVHHRFH